MGAAPLSNAPHFSPSLAAMRFGLFGHFVHYLYLKPTFVVLRGARNMLLT